MADLSYEIKELNEKIQQESAFIDLLTREIRKVIIGQKHLIDSLLIGLLSDGHILLEGVPGLAKTLAVNTLSGTVSGIFSRIQFTPDLLPADLIGTMIYSLKKEEFVVRKGPIFANFVLADEINRSPAKVQSALLEAMQEKQVTIGEQSFKLEEPFLVFATQNPIEQEGTYPLPEAQVDRFMMKLRVTYPTRKEELEIMSRFSSHKKNPIEPVISPAEILKVRETVNSIYLDPKIEGYIVDVVLATREPQTYKLENLSGMINFGASPRATISICQAAKAHAFVQGRGYVTPHDVKSVGHDILRHRIILTYEAEAEDITHDEVITRIFNGIDVP